MAAHEHTFPAASFAAARARELRGDTDSSSTVERVCIPVPLFGAAWDSELRRFERSLTVSHDPSIQDIIPCARYRGTGRVSLMPHPPLSQGLAWVRRLSSPFTRSNLISNIAPIFVADNGIASSWDGLKCGP